MRYFKLSMALILACLLAGPAMAGGMPEFDAVGCDNQNVFAASNFAQFGQVIALNTWEGYPINYRSWFYNEYFDGDNYSTALTDPCFGQDSFFGSDFESVLVSAWNPGYFEWGIVLQMKPDSDINLNIYDCVLEAGTITPFGYWWMGATEFASAEQTGRYINMSNLELGLGPVFMPGANPMLTVTAYAREGSFNMDARLLPTLDVVALDQALYTSKGIWDEEIVMVNPDYLGTNAKGQTTYPLRQGDLIQVRVDVPQVHFSDVRYGADSVLLKYIGIYGHYEFSDYGYCDDFQVIAAAE